MLLLPFHVSDAAPLLVIVCPVTIVVFSEMKKTGDKTH